MRSPSDTPHGAHGRPRRTMRLALAGLVAMVAALVVPGIASAATHTGSVSALSTSNALKSGFALYHFHIQSDTPGDTAPFGSGDKVGHCVEATIGWGKNSSTLRTGNDLSLDNTDAQNTIGSGFGFGAQRVEWILLTSYRDSPGDATGVQAAAHQSAIWQLTNPSQGDAVKLTGTSDKEKDAAAKASQLLSDSLVYAGSVNNAAGLTVDGGADLETCSCTSRMITITGAPFTDVDLTASGAAVFHDGGGIHPAHTVNLGGTGSAQVQIDSTGPGAVNVTATIHTATMVQADNGGNQDFVYLDFTHTTKSVTITFKDCKDLTVTKTAIPTVDRAYTWTIKKSVVGPDSKTADAGTSVGFDYTVDVTKSAPVDSNWKVTGTISVTNPNAFPVTGTVADDILVEPTDTCTIVGGATQVFPANKTTLVGYTCSFSSKPSYAQLTNCVSVTWQMPGMPAPAVDKGEATFSFGSPVDPTTSHDAIDVYDIFNGAPAPGTLLGHTSVSTSYAVHRDITVPSGIAGCMDVDNTATFKDANPSNTPSNSSSVTTHVCVAGHDLTIKKTVKPTYTKTYTWTIDKKVNGKDSDGPISSDQPTVPAHYTVVTTKSAGTSHNFELDGTITVTNPNSFAVSGASVTDQAPTGFTCTVVGGTLGSIAAGASVTVDYSCNYSGQTAPTTGTNHATVDWTAATIPNDSTGHTSAGADAAYDFATAAVRVEHNAVDVTDTNTNANLATNVTAGGTYSYDLNLPVPNFACATIPNTAKVIDTGKPGSVLDSDTASIQLCRTQKGLALSKTAEPSYTRSFDWTIAKSVDQTAVTTSADTATFNYTVVATKSAATDSGWQVTGAITVTNPNVYTVTDVLIAEQGVDNGGVCTLNSTGAIGTLVQGQTASVGYTCTYAALPAPAAGTNTANVTWTLPASGETPASPQTATVTQAFLFGDPTTTLHNAVNVADSFDGAALVGLDGGTAITASKTFTYARTVAVPATDCRVYLNKASVTATDSPAYSPNASASIQVCRQAPPTPPLTPKAPVTPPVTPASVPKAHKPSRTTISLSKRASSPTVKAGGTVSFTIRWKNTGKATAKNVVICDDLPNQLTFVSAKGSTFKNGKACWRRKSVAKGTTLTFRVVARVDASVGNEKLVNVATATASNAKPATAKAPVRALRNARTRTGGVTG
jgi:uncharacterized repeat protein (TIGR01451 family)